jgi:RNA polymerase sigma factor (sigma-70 family)
VGYHHFHLEADILMAIGKLYSFNSGWTIMDLGPASAENYHRSRQVAKYAHARSKDKGERRVIQEMVSDCEYAIEWLETGRRPGIRRGIERRAAYQRERPMDPVALQSYFRNSTAGSPANITDSERFRLDDAMQGLSSLERECFELAYGQCFSHADIALMLNVSKGNVSTLLERANRKIQVNKSNSLFLLE